MAPRKPACTWVQQHEAACEQWAAACAHGAVPLAPPLPYLHEVSCMQPAYAPTRQAFVCQPCSPVSTSHTRLRSPPPPPGMRQCATHLAGAVALKLAPAGTHKPTQSATEGCGTPRQVTSNHWPEASKRVAFAWSAMPASRVPTWIAPTRIFSKGLWVSLAPTLIVNTSATSAHAVMAGARPDGFDGTPAMRPLGLPRRPWVASAENASIHRVVLALRRQGGGGGFPAPVVPVRRCVKHPRDSGASRRQTAFQVWRFTSQPSRASPRLLSTAVADTPIEPTIQQFLVAHVATLCLPRICTARRAAPGAVPVRAAHVHRAPWPAAAP